MKEKDFFERYLDFVEANTECPLIYHRWCAIALIGATVGRNIRVVHGHQPIYPNMYIMLIGPPATRKSTAINIAKAVADAAGYSTIFGSKVSKEKFLLDFSEGFGEEYDPPTKGGRKSKILGQDELWSIMESPGGKLPKGTQETRSTDPKHVWIVNGEFNNFLGYNNLEFVSILGDLWDNLPEFEVRNKNSQNAFIYQPSVNILGGNTQQNLASSLPAESIGQGFTSRWLLIQASEKNKDLPFPDAPCPTKRKKLAEHLKKIKQLVREHDEIILTPEAKDLLSALYTQPNHLGDSRFEYYFNRRFIHVIKVCSIVALADLRVEVTAADVLYGNSILGYAEQFMPAALGEFGKSKYSDLNNQIMNILRDKPTSANQLFKNLAQDCNGIQDITSCISMLHQAGKIQRFKGSSMLDPQWEAKEKLIKNNAFVEFSLLFEAGYKSHDEAAAPLAPMSQERKADRQARESASSGAEQEESITSFLSRTLKQATGS